MTATALRTAAMLLSVVLVAAACAGSGTPGRSPGTGGSPDPTPADPTPPPGPIAHPAGAADLVLRFEEGGGFVPFGALFTQAPEFSIYGDGTVVVRNTREGPPPDIDGVSRQQPFRTARLAEPDIQALLAFALSQGGLGAAREHYEHNQVADAPSTVFTVDADGVRKVVDVYALGFEFAPPGDAAARQSFTLLVERLRGLAADSGFAVDRYTPPGYRALLGEGFPGNQERPWPWPHLTPADFTVPNPELAGIPQRVLTPDEMAAVGVPGHEGGILNAMLRGPDGLLYTLSTRPLLPDDPS